MDPLVVRTAWWFRVFFLAVATSLIALGWSLYHGAEEMDRGDRLLWLCVLVAAGAVCAVPAVDGRPRLVIDEAGVRAKQFGVIEWADITNAFVVRRSHR